MKKKNEMGLLFISFQKSIKNQFEVMVNDWLLNEFEETPYDNNTEKDTDRFRRTNRDLLFCKKGDKYPIPQHWNISNHADFPRYTTELEIKASLVDLKGSLYFFVPCISFFKNLYMFTDVAEAKPLTVGAVIKMQTMGSSVKVGDQLLKQSNTSPPFIEFENTIIEEVVPRGSEKKKGDHLFSDEVVLVRKYEPQEVSETFV